MKDQIVKLALKAKETDTLPLTVTNQDFSLIEESALIIQALENEGFVVETFADRNSKTYGIVVS